MVASPILELEVVRLVWRSLNMCVFQLYECRVRTVLHFLTFMGILRVQPSSPDGLTCSS